MSGPRRLALVLVLAAMLLALAFALPRVDLTGGVALCAYWVAESGGRYGLPLAVGLLTALLISRPGLKRRRRMDETLIVLLTLAGVLGGGAYSNEHYVKPAFAVARPNVRELSTTPGLTVSVEDFYALPDKAARSERLTEILTAEVPMDARIRRHWIAETGYAFPSGHSFAAMTLATFFAALGLRDGMGWRRWALVASLAWALAVCFSRPLLRVHWPTDVLVGGLEGMAAGLLAFAVVTRLMRRRGWGVGMKPA